jgi:hypothetical protein
MVLHLGNAECVAYPHSETAETLDAAFALFQLKWA